MKYILLGLLIFSGCTYRSSNCERGFLVTTKEFGTTFCENVSPNKDIGYTCGSTEDFDKKVDMRIGGNAQIERTFCYKPLHTMNVPETKK